MAAARDMNSQPNTKLSQYPGGPSGHPLADVTKLERLRRIKVGIQRFGALHPLEPPLRWWQEYAPLDFEGVFPGDVLSACSVGGLKDLGTNWGKMYCLVVSVIELHAYHISLIRNL